MSDKLTLKEKISYVDLNVRELWDALDEVQQKDLKNDFYILNRYISNVTSSNPDVVAHYIMTVNEYYNKHWFDLSDHPKLQWMLLCMCNYNGQTQFYHEWLACSRSTSSNKLESVIADEFPDLKADEVTLLTKLMTPDEIKQLLKDLSWTDKEIQKIVK